MEAYEITSDTFLKIFIPCFNQIEQEIENVSGQSVWVNTQTCKHADTINHSSWTNSISKSQASTWFKILFIILFTREEKIAARLNME